MEQDAGATNGPATITGVLSQLEAKGYTGQFAARPGAEIQCFTCRQAFPGGEAALEDLYRLEGASDPADMAAVGALTCPRCGARGTIVLQYGPESTPEEDEALLVLQDHRRAPGVGPGASP